MVRLYFGGAISRARLVRVMDAAIIDGAAPSKRPSTDRWPRSDGLQALLAFADAGQTPVLSHGHGIDLPVTRNFMRDARIPYVMFRQRLENTEGKVIAYRPDLAVMHPVAMRADTEGEPIFTASDLLAALRTGTINDTICRNAQLAFVSLPKLAIRDAA